jgi:cobalamin biosynthesis Mg chelatase CobN
MPTAIANEVYKWDVMVLNRPDSDRCDVVAYASDRNALYASLATKWNSLSSAQRDQATKDALAVAANPPLDTTAAWVNWTPGAAAATTGPSLMNRIADAANAAAAAAAAQAANVALQQAQAAAQAEASSKGVVSAETANRLKNAQLLASMKNSALTRSTTLPMQTITPGKSNTTLIVGGIAAAAVIGGILYFTLGKKKAA